MKLNSDNFYQMPLYVNKTTDKLYAPSFHITFFTYNGATYVNWPAGMRQSVT